jgi:prepilin-type N-terminal cleavage/methylation domain-containing protein
VNRADRALSADSGYTLVELMTVVLIIAILLAMALASYVPATNAANAAACRNNQAVLEKAYSVVTAQTGERPDDMDDLASSVANFDRVRTCPADGTALTLDASSGDVSCPNHP